MNNKDKNKTVNNSNNLNFDDVIVELEGEIKGNLKASSDGQENQDDLVDDSQDENENNNDIEDISDNDSESNNDMDDIGSGPVGRSLPSDNGRLPVDRERILRPGHDVYSQDVRSGIGCCPD